MKLKMPISFLAVGLGLGLGMHGQGMPQGKMMDMNDMPYAQVKQVMSDPQKKQMAMEMAKKNHVTLMAGMAVEGKPVTLKGELTGANCYLSMGLHGHNHALCAKACVLAGSPVLFLAERAGKGPKVYTVLTAKDGMPLPEAALDALGRPGVTVNGKLVRAHGVEGLAVESVE